MRNLFDVLPVYGVEHNAILSKMGDVTVAFKVELPELFTMSNDEYEGLLETMEILQDKVLTRNLLKAIKRADQGQTISFEKAIGRKQRR